MSQADITCPNETDKASPLSDPFHTSAEHTDNEHLTHPRLWLFLIHMYGHLRERNIDPFFIQAVVDLLQYPPLHFPVIF